MARTLQLQSVDHLPPEVADIIILDLEDRERDLFRDAARERELSEAADLIRGGEPIPKSLYATVAASIEVTLRYNPRNQGRIPEVRAELESAAAALHAAS